MSELDEIWKARGNGPSRWCHRHGFVVTGCTHYMDCKDCKTPPNEVKYEQPKPIKPKRRTRIRPQAKDISVSKRTRKPRNEAVSSKKASRKPKKAPKGTGRSRGQGRIETTHQERFGA